MSDVTWAKLVEIIGFEPNTRQREAITAPLAPAVIVAGAGTGKTAVMTARVVWLVLTGQVEPQEILGLTFTNKAAGELRERVGHALRKAVEQIATGSPDGAHIVANFGEPTIATYNSFGSSLLSEHALRVGYEPDSQVVVDATRNQLAAQLLRQTKLPIGTLDKSPRTLVKDLLSFDDTCANYSVDLAKLIEADNQRLIRMRAVDQIGYGNDIIAKAEQRILMAALVGEFRDLKRKFGFIDYADQIRLASLIATSSPDLASSLQATYKVVLLDEYQDTSQSQRDLLLALFGNGHPVTAVGDPCQAIYAWRGAQVANISNFHEQFVISEQENAAQQKLSGNRRSGKRILAGANVVSSAIRELHPEVAELSVEGDKPEGLVKVGLYETQTLEAKALAEQVSLLAQAGRKLSDIAILVRDRSFNSQLLRALDERNIPVQLVDAGDLIDYPEVREVLCYLEVLDDPCANIALTRILTSSRWAIGSRDLAILGKRARDLVRGTKLRGLPLDEALRAQSESADSAATLSLLDALYDLGAGPKFTYSDEALERFAQLRAEFDLLRANLALSVPDLILRIYRLTGLSVESQISERKITGADHISAFIDLAGSFTSLDGGSSLAAFLRYLRDGALHQNETKLDAPVVEDAVVLMTMHKAKGLEFPIVFLPGFSEGKFPSKKGDSFWPTSATQLPPEVLDGDQFDWMRPLANLAAPKTKDKEEFSDEYKKRRQIEERRLAYVAITRAKELLFVSGAWWGPTQQEPFGPNSFLLELRDQADEVLQWHEGPVDGEINPGFADIESALWQVGGALPEVVEAAQLVNLARAGKLKTDLALSAVEQAQMAHIEKDVDALIELLHESYSDEIIVDLPRNLSASAILKLRDDVDTFARELVRPMPKPPAPAATRGTMFHAWVEQFFDAPATLPLEDMNVFDEWAYRDDELPKLQENFRNGPFAQRVPLAIELPFSLTINSRVVQGRIDGIFAEPADSAHDYLIVDWKTGASANPLQLEIYRHAFAAANDISPDRVQAAFYHVATNELNYLTNPLDWDALVAQLEI